MMLMSSSVPVDQLDKDGSADIVISVSEIDIGVTVINRCENRCGGARYA